MTEPTDPATGDLLCLHLLAVEESDRTGGPENATNLDDRTSAAAATSGILGALDVGEGAITDHFAVISALSELVDRGLVAKRTAAGDSDGEGTVYELTGTGREHAREVRGELAERTVTLQSADGAETTTLSGAAERFDGSLVAAATRLQDGVLVLDDIEDAVGVEETPFVGRADELARLERRYETAASGANPLVMDGEPGVGKTYLVGEFGDRVADRGGVFLSTRPVPETDDPYAPFLDAVGDLPDPRRERLTDPLTTGGSDASAPVGDDPGGPGDPEDLERRRRSLFESVADELATLVAERPVVLALDDVQRLDRPTALLAAHLASELADAPFALVATVSPTDPDPTATLEAGLEAYDLSPTTITLGPLDREATATLVHRLVGTRRVPGSFVDALADHTGGNPLFVVESVDRLLDSGRVRPAADVYPESVTDLPVPGTVEEAIVARVATLDDGTRELAELAALAGGTVPDSVLAAASALDRHDVADRTDVLVESRLWERSGDRAVRFVSDVVRETVGETVSGERRRDLHRRLATAYEATGDGSGERAAAAAHHYDRAGDVPRALEASVVAAERATDVYAHEVAIEACERAVELAREAGDDEALVEALELLGDTYSVVGEYGEATRCYRYVRERSADPAVVRRSRRRAGTVALKRGEFDDAEDAFRAALESAREAGDRRGEARSLAGLGRVADRRGRLDEAERRLQRSRRVFDDLDADHERAETLLALGRVAEKRGDHDTARAHLRESLVAHRDAGDRRGEAACLSELGEVQRKQSEFDEARESHRRCLSIYRDLGDRDGQAQTLGNLGSLEQMDCEFDEAREYFRRSLERRRDLGDRHGEAKCLGNLGLVADEEGRFDEAGEYLRECLDVFRELDDRYGVAKCHYLVGMTARRAGDLTLARAHVQQGLAMERHLGNRRGEAKALDMLARVERTEGALDAARRHHRDALELYRDLDNPLGSAESLLALGLVELVDADGERALELFERAREAFANVDDPVGPRRCRALLGAARIRTGDVNAGRDLLAPAVDFLATAGVTPAALEALRHHIEAELARGHDEYAAGLCERARTLVDGTDAELGVERDRLERRCAEVDA